MIDKSARVYVAGHRGLVGSAVCRRLQAGGYRTVLTRDRRALELTDAQAVDAFFAAERPEYVVLAAAKVGGILANDRFSADFLRENLLIQTHVLDAAYRYDIKKLIFLGSSCIYPKLAPQPLREEYLLTGTLEPTNEAYAIAKIAGIIACKSYNKQHGTNFITAMPTNLYGPGDNFDLQTSHVMPAMIRKFHDAKVAGAPSVELWGTGSPKREFLYVDDVADACAFMLEKVDAGGENFLLNVGVGEDVSVANLAELVREIVGYEGEIVWNSEMPDGTPRKLLDTSRLTALGWRARTPLTVGMGKTYTWFKEHWKG